MQDGKFIDTVAPDGVRTVAEIAGPPDGPGVIFIHGVLHSRLIWQRQFADPALACIRKVAYDVRGHGDADKPFDPAHYSDPHRYADELDAVIAASGIARPVLVGWSLGSRIMFGYIGKYGTDRVAGMMMVGARLKTLADPPQSAAGDALAESCSDNLQTRIRARKTFVTLCHQRPPEPADLFEIAAAAMVVPPQVLRNIVGRPLDVQAQMAALAVPVRIIQGAEDRINPTESARAAAQINPRATLSIYDGIGHTPSFEATERFDRDLLSLVTACSAAHGEPPVQP